MSIYKDVETTLYIQDVEFPCTFSFDYQPEEPASMDGTGCDELVTITAAVIEPRKGFIVDIFTPEYDWIMVSDLHDALKSDALYHISQLNDYIAESKADHDYNQKFGEMNENYIL